MNYEDDELERMRARREQRRNASQSGSGRGTDTRRNADGGGDAFRSGYRAPEGVQAGEVLQEELPEKGAGSRK